MKTPLNLNRAQPLIEGRMHDGESPLNMEVGATLWRAHAKWRRMLNEGTHANIKEGPIRGGRYIWR